VKLLVFLTLKAANPSHIKSSADDPSQTVICSETAS
jgi:hypothetical protein